MDLFKQGLARNPEDPELLSNYRSTLGALGYLQEALEVSERVHLLEPLVPLYNRHRAVLLLANGKSDAGTSELERLNRQGLGGALIYLPAALAQQGRFAELVALLQGATPNDSGSFTRPLTEAALQVFRAAASKSDVPARLPDFYSELHFVYAYTSTPERMLDWPEKALKDGDYRPLQSVWWPIPPRVRKTERFKVLMRNAGLVDYWRVL